MGKLSKLREPHHEVSTHRPGAKLWLDESQLRRLRQIAAESHVTPDDLISLAVDALLSHIPREVPGD